MIMDELLRKAKMIYDHLERSTGGAVAVERYEVCKNGTIRVYGSYHCMNQNGYWDGYAEFVLVWKKEVELINFVLLFLGRFSQRQDKKYGLREYLEEQFAYVLPRIPADMPEIRAIT